MHCPGVFLQSRVEVHAGRVGVCRSKRAPLVRSVEGVAIFGSRARWWFALALCGVGLAGLGVGLVGLDGTRSAARAEAAAVAEAPSFAQGGNLVVAATPLGDTSVVVCLVDTTRQRLAVYVADTRRSRLKLLAVRDISADWALSDYNNDPPLPKDVRARVEALKGTGRPAADAEDDEQPAGER